jgi:hypothetical protein
MNTAFLLMAEFQTAHIPLDNLCEKYFGMKRAEANRKASLQMLPVPVFRAGSNKSGYLVDLNELAKYLDEMNFKARNLHQKMHSAG